MTAGQEIYGKQLQLLKDAFPRVSRVAILVNQAVPSYARASREIEIATRALGLHGRPWKSEILASLTTRSRR